MEATGRPIRALAPKYFPNHFAGKTDAKEQ